MQDLEKDFTKKILLAVHESQYLFPQIAFSIENGNLRLLGSGGFSSVYEMYNIAHPEQKYALKVTGLQRHSTKSQDFWDTIYIQRTLNQESRYVMHILDVRELIVGIADHGSITNVQTLSPLSQTEIQDDNRHVLKLQFVLMEKLLPLLEKDRFKHVFLTRDALTQEGEILKFAREIGQALHFAHSRKILHRDIKLENIFWDEQTATYKLGDFGAAKNTMDGTAKTAIYTTGYGAPEIKQSCDSSYRETADIYSFGITLYLLFNDLKFPGSEGYFSNVQIQYSPEFAFPAPIHASAPVACVIRKMCSFYPEDRYQSIAEALADLENAYEVHDTPVSPELLRYEDEETVTYKQTQAASTQSSRSDTRAERLLAQEANDRIYLDANIRFFITMTLLLTVVLKCFQPETPAIGNWLFWTIPIAVFFEAILQKLKEFHLIFGVLVVGYIAYSIQRLGLTAGHIILLTATVTGFPVITAASAASTAIFAVLVSTGNFGWADFLISWDLGWLGLLFLLLAGYRYLIITLSLEKANYLQTIVGAGIYGILPITMLVVGFLLYALEKTNLLQVPEILQRMHLIRIVLGYVFILVMYQVAYPDETENTDTDELVGRGDDTAQ